MSPGKSPTVRPRIILHGGAGNITRENLPTAAYNAYRNALLGVLHDAHEKLRLPGATALDIATYAVSLLEDNGLFNAGHGAVFTTAGTHELEASVMVSRGYRKRGVGVMNVRTAKNPIKLAREMLIRGEEKNGGGAGAHCQLEGQTCDRLVEEWGLETVKPSYFWTRRRWDEHRRGLGKKYDDETYERHKKMADEETEVEYRDQRDILENDNSLSAPIFDASSWEGKEYLPQGTVGAVVLDSSGMICTATSTGGLTNKLPGRIGDTPTLGAGFWAEEWQTTESVPVQENSSPMPSTTSLAAMVSDCIPGLSGYMSFSPPRQSPKRTKQVQKVRALGVSGTGNGDSFLRVNAARTAGAIARFSGPGISSPVHTSEASRGMSLQHAVSTVAGPGGMLQQSAEDRWQKTGEGQGGIIGIDLNGCEGTVVFDFNCGGLFHAWVDDEGTERFAVFQDER